MIKVFEPTNEENYSYKTLRFIVQCSLSFLNLKSILTFPIKVLIIMHNCVNINYVFNQNKTSAISYLIEIIKFLLICFINPKCIILSFFLAGINKKCIGIYFMYFIWIKKVEPRCDISWKEWFSCQFFTVTKKLHYRIDITNASFLLKRFFSC